MITNSRSLAAILPCNDLDASVAFYRKLGFTQQNEDDDYRILSDGRGGSLHLTNAVDGWLVRGRNPFGLYLYTEDVDVLAASLGELVLHKPEHKPWGCTNSRSPIRTKHWCALVGRASSEKIHEGRLANREPRQTSAGTLHPIT